MPFDARREKLLKDLISVLEEAYTAKHLEIGEFKTLLGMAIRFARHNGDVPREAPRGG